MQVCGLSGVRVVGVVVEVVEEPGCHGVREVLSWRWYLEGALCTVVVGTPRLVQCAGSTNAHNAAF